LVTILLDELPLVALLDEHGEIDGRLFPNIARLAKASHWFRNATTTGSYTDLAVPSLHTGRYPSDREILAPTFESYPDNLFSLLDGSYRIFALETTTDLQPPALRRSGDADEARGGGAGLLRDTAAIAAHLVTPPPWNARLPAIDSGWATSGASRRRAMLWPGATRRRGASPHRSRRHVWRRRPRADAWARPAASCAASSRVTGPLSSTSIPSSPHMPWEYLPSGRSYYDPETVPGLIDKLTWADDRCWCSSRISGCCSSSRPPTAWSASCSIAWSARLARSRLVVLAADHGTVFTPGLSRRDLGRPRGRDPDRDHGRPPAGQAAAATRRRPPRRERGADRRSPDGGRRPRHRSALEGRRSLAGSIPTPWRARSDGSSCGSSS
jgi:hypothetical protein